MKLLPRFWRQHYLGCELVLALIVSGALIGWCEWFGQWPGLRELLLGDRLIGFYGTIASTFGALLGFIIASTTFLVGSLNHERLRPVRESPSYRSLWDTFLSTTRWLGFGTVVALINLLINSSGQTLRWLVYLLVVGVAISFLRLFRCIWILENVIRIVTLPPKR